MEHATTYNKKTNVSRFVFISSAYSYIGKVISVLFSLLAFIIIARKLAIGDYGRYAYYLNFVYFVTLLLDFGVAELILRYVSELVEKGKVSLIKGLLQRAVLVISTGTLVLLSLVSLAALLFPSIILKSGFKVTILQYIIIFGLFRIISQVLANVLNSFLFQIYRISAEIFISILKLVVIFILLQCVADPWILIVAYSLLDLLTIVIFYFKLRKPLSSAPLTKDKARFSRMFKYGIHEYFFKLFWFFTDNRVDIYIVGFVLGMKQAGYFAFAAGIMNALVDWSPGFIIRPIINPFFIREHVLKKDNAKILYLFQMHNKFIFFITFPVFLLLAVVLDKVIIYIFDPKYLPAMQTFLIFIASMFFVNMVIPLRNIISLIEKPSISNFTNIVAVPKLILVFLFARWMGISGAAIAYALSLFTIILINVMLIKKTIKISFPWQSFGKVVFNSIIMAALVYFLKIFINDKFNLILLVLFGALIYIAVSYINKAFNEEDREIFNRAFKLKIWNF